MTFPQKIETQGEISAGGEPRYRDALTPPFRVCRVCFQIPEWCHGHPGVPRSQRDHQPGDPVSDYTRPPRPLCACSPPGTVLSARPRGPAQILCLPLIWPAAAAGCSLVQRSPGSAPGTHGHLLLWHSCRRGRVGRGFGGEEAGLLLTVLGFFGHDFRVPNPRP